MDILKKKKYCYLVGDLNINIMKMETMISLHNLLISCQEVLFYHWSLVPR